MICSGCGQENRAGRKFCAGCGSPLSLVCGSCGATNEPGERFCGQCGRPLGEEAAAPARTPSPAPSPALPASFADGRYRVKGFLGEGGRKRVYLAHDTKLDRDVAFALIKTEGLDAEGLTRVRREAQAMGRLGDHPHIVTVYDTGEEAGAPYIVSQYMAGGAVEDLLRKAEAQRLPLEQALRIAEEACQALEHAHDQGIIHRDLKPGNVWLTAEGSAMLGDFGLAVALDRSRMTMAGMMVGTVAYMAPEQALGRQPDARSDLYSLGAMLYEMVTGRPPFLGDDVVAVISQHINTAPVAPGWHNPALPKPLEALILRLLAKAPDERPASAREVAAELRRVRDLSTQEVVAEAAAPALERVAWGRFVGRQEEMGQLKSHLESTLSGRGALVMLVGEPGIGKTRLAEEFAVYASLRGAQVMTGHCYEGEVAVPYLPFVEAFRQYMQGRPDPALRQELGGGAPEVAKLVSEVRQRLPDVPEAPPLEGDAERHRLFQSVTDFLRNAATANPLVLFLDDIHWADKPSLLLLQYLARGLRSDRALIVGAYRDVELDRTHPLSDAVAALRRDRLYERVLLRGLPPEDVQAMIEALGNQETPQAFAQAIYQETEGNPFFVEEVLKHLLEEGKIFMEAGRWTSRATSVSELGIPEGVREVIGRRLSRLSEACNRVLTLASTMTGGFSWELLGPVSGESEEKLLDLLDEALRAQVIRERKDPSTGSGQARRGTYEFTHALIRQTLYGELNTPRRVRLHRQIGEAIERLYSASPEPHLSELAHHFFQAAPGGDVEKAIDYARRAGDRAVGLLAYEEAAQEYGMALQALELRDQPAERLRCDLLLPLGDAEARAGEAGKAMATLEQAMALADGLKDPQLVGTATLAYENACARGPLAFTEAAVPELERALTAVGEEESALRCQLLTALARTLMRSVLFSPGPLRERALQVVGEANELAERLGDAALRLGALNTLHFILQGPEHTPERVQVAEEALRLAQEAGDKAHIMSAHIGQMFDSLELGDIETVDRELAAIWPLVDDMREPFYLGLRPFWGAMRAIMEGRLAEGEQQAQQALAWGQRLGLELALQGFAVQIFNIRLQQGRAGELEGLLERTIEQAPGVVSWLPALALLYLLSGKEAEARETFEQLAADDFKGVPMDSGWLTAMNRLATVASHLQDERRAATLYEMLLPYRNRCIVIANAVICDGSASRPLGMLATALGRWDEAEALFQEAIEMNARIGARPNLARAQYEYAVMLLARDAPDASTSLGAGRQKALGLLDEALALFNDIGMKRDIELALKLKVQAQGLASGDIYTSIDAVASAVYVEKPDLRPHTAPDGTVTILFSDIEGSTALNERLGDKRWMEVLREHNAIVREKVKAHGGFEVKSEGDGFMVAFQSARRAVECAIAIQQALEARNAAGEAVRVRMGLHTGEPLKEGDDFFGRHVNLAARVAGQAKGGEILVSGLLKALVDSGGDISWGESRMVELKGLSGTQEVWAVVWAADS